MLFLTTSEGEKVDTATAWWRENEVGTRFPLVHWVAIHPDYQQRELSKPLLSKVLEILKALEGDSSFYLKTQTWSHRAIGLYEQFGFELSEKDLDGRPVLDYEKAVEILKQL